MLGQIKSAALVGLECESVEVEVDILLGLPAFAIVGLPDAAIQESRERVHSAIQNTGFPYPRTRIVVNLAPAHLRKIGPHYDLPIALGVIIAYGLLDPALLKNTLVVGELALEGSVRPIHGILAIAEFATHQKYDRLILPAGNYNEAKGIGGVELIPVNHLKEVIPLLTGQQKIIVPPAKEPVLRPKGMDMADIIGQEQAKRAIEIAAAGGHNLLLNGAPGAGKTMLAKVLPSILPPISLEEALAVTKIYSVAGRLKKNQNLIAERPFRTIHHTASAISIVGGGNPPRPGEISLAHRGILFLDELAEFPKPVLEVLRQPLEDHRVTVSRAQGSVVFPAQFTLIAAMNPCPCGYYNIPHPTQKCRCNAYQIQRYHKKISGPLLDRIDMHLFVNPVDPRYFKGKKIACETSEMVRNRVERTRDIQRRRFEKEDILTNSEMGNSLIQTHCQATDAAASLLHRAMETFGYSARGYYRILKTARTIADLAESERIEEGHIAEALQYRHKFFNSDIMA